MNEQDGEGNVCLVVGPSLIEQSAGQSCKLKLRVIATFASGAMKRIGSTVDRRFCFKGFQTAGLTGKANHYDARVPNRLSCCTW